jgi:hypothetical protein
MAVPASGTAASAALVVALAIHGQRRRRRLLPFRKGSYRLFAALIASFVAAVISSVITTIVAALFLEFALARRSRFTASADLDRPFGPYILQDHAGLLQL